MGDNRRFDRISDKSTPFSSCSPYWCGPQFALMYSSSVMALELYSFQRSPSPAARSYGAKITGFFSLDIAARPVIY